MNMSAATEQIMFDEMMRVRKRGKHSPHESNYMRLFGTPERTVRTLFDYNAFKQCVDCPVCHDEYGKTCEIPGDCVFVTCDGDALLEWLEGDAR